MSTTRCITLLALFAGVFSITAADFKIGAYTLTVPDGFTIEKVAASPLVDRPIVADFDEEGRLYVADSSGSNDNVQQQLEERPHRIVRLTDTDGDGVFDKQTVFADRMMFPEGTMWLNGSLYVSAPPSIWKLTDTDGDGVADQREEWFNGTLTGCANDLHGPYLGPDGWIYWAKGAFAKQTHTSGRQEPFTTRAAHIFRAPPSGSPIEPVMTGGMDNPVDVVFTPEGDRIFTTTFLQHPGGGKRDGLIHAVYGGVYGKVHEVIDEHPRTGDVLPPLTHLGPAAPSGLERYASGNFGAAYRDNLFAALFNMRKVTRHILERDGATYRTVDSDFLVCDNPDFHPTDVIEDADGSLLVIDTGGWYKICCPTSQLSKPDVLGAIYRIRKTGAPKPKDPRGLELHWAQMSERDLAALLGDEERHEVRDRAVHLLAARGILAVPVLKDVLKTVASVETRRNAVWTLTRIDAPEARATIRTALADTNDSVRHAAVLSVALWRDRQALSELLPILATGTPALRRVAAEALGRLGDKRAVPPLLQACGGAADRMLEHAFTYALIEIAAPSETAAGLNSPNIGTRRAALIALDQMRGGAVKADQVLPLLQSTEPRLESAAQWIAEQHPEWGEEMALFLAKRIKTVRPKDREDLETLLSKAARGNAVQNLLADSINDSAIPEESRVLLLRAMGRSGVKEIPPQWKSRLEQTLTGTDPDLLAEAVRTLRRLPPPKGPEPGITKALRRVAAGESFPAELRLEALAAIPGTIEELSPSTFALVKNHATAENALRRRTAAAAVLARARLSEEQLLQLIPVLGAVGPMEFPAVLQAFEHGSSESLGLKLLAALRDVPTASTLRADILKPLLKNYPASVQARLDGLLTALHRDLPEQQTGLEELLARVKTQTGDIRRGQALFGSARTSCTACHAIGYIGGDLGPDLTSIGTVRTERDLLEALVYPSASFVRSYNPVTVTTADGELYNGILREDAEDEIVLATGPGIQTRLARQNIASIEPGKFSLMPAGLTEQLSIQELADLLAFLKNTRWGAK